MRALPIVMSVPHAGLQIPAELEDRNLLTAHEIAADGDVGAAEIYGPLVELVQVFVSTPVARAFVDVNRAMDDRRPDGVVKTHTCWGVPIYSEPLEPSVTEELLTKHYRPYHESLDAGAATAIFGIDCHTMASVGPPVGPDPGSPRPRICLSDGDGMSCPRELFEALATALSKSFALKVSRNDPFKGGYITRSRPGGIPWMQLELSREEWMPYSEKTAALVEALRNLGL